MNKKKAKISLVVLALVTVLFAYTVIIGIGKTGTGAIRNIILGLDLSGGVSITYEASGDEEPSAEETSRDASTNPTLADENTSSPTSHSVRLPSEYLLNSTIRLFHQMVQIFRENAAPPSNPMGIRIDSKRRKKLMQKRLAMGHKQDDHEQNYGQTLQ